MSELNDKMIEEKMLLFDKYLERTNMDKKAYQYDGVKWCLRNEILQPLLLEKEEQKKSIVKSKHGVQRRDGIDMGGDSEDHESLEDRLIRKATKISA